MAPLEPAGTRFLPGVVISRSCDWGARKGICFGRLAPNTMYSVRIDFRRTMLIDLVDSVYELYSAGLLGSL